MTPLSRVGTSVLILALLVGAAALMLGLFPRTIIGTLVLLVAGLPLCLVGEALGEFAFSDRPRAWYIRGGALAGIIAMIALLWWRWDNHASFVRRNFVG